MQIRAYRESDLAALSALHSAQGFPYAFPDLRDPLFVTKLVLTDDSAVSNGQPGLGAPEVASASHPPRGNERTRAGNCAIHGAALLRLTAEAYLLLDPRAGSPRDRWNWLLALHAAAERDAWLRGLEDVHAWLPPRIAARFGKRIAQLGWRRDDSWTPYCKRLEVRA